MKLPRLAPFARILLLSLGAAGFVLAAVSLALDVVILGQRHVETAAVAAPAPVGITRWSDLEPENPTAFAAHLRALGCPEATVKVLAAASAQSDETGRFATTGGRDAGDHNPPTSPVVSSGGFSAEAGQGQIATGTSVSVVAAQHPAPVVDAETSVSDLGGVAEGDGTRMNSSPAAQRGSSVNPRRGLAGAPGAARGGAISSGSSMAAQEAAGSGANTTNAGDSPIVAPEGNVPIPAAFADAAPSERKLSPAQQQQLSEIQDQFARTVTKDGIGNDPTSPAYKRVWKDAGWLADQQFKALFGYQAFLQREMNQGAN